MSARPPRFGRAPCHFGEFLQGRLGPDGPVVLVTLPCPALSVAARWFGGGAVSVHGAGRALMPRARLRRLAAAAPGRCRGTLHLATAAEPGAGAGTSTAALLATWRSLGLPEVQSDMAAAFLAIEGAVDPLMLAAPETHLWASRCARSLARMPPLPAFRGLGAHVGPPERTVAADTRFPDITDLLAPWRAAAARRDRAGLAGLAETSALRTARMRGKRDLARIASAGRAHGALGAAIAHTGSAVVWLFAPGQVPDGALAALTALGGRGAFWFSTERRPWAR